MRLVLLAVGLGGGHVQTGPLEVVNSIFTNNSVIGNSMLAFCTVSLSACLFCLLFCFIFKLLFPFVVVRCIGWVTTVCLSKTHLFPFETSIDSLISSLLSLSLTPLSCLSGH